MAPYRAGQKVLIIAHDPMLAALVGSLVETARLEPAFTLNGERPDQAIDRVRPVLLILLDVEDDVAESELFLAKARRSGIPVALFGSDRGLEERQHWISERNIPAFALPKQLARFVETLNHVRRGDGLRRGGERRAPEAARPDHEFRDGRGTRWTVYDRRGADRRQEVDRRFVSETGESRHCLISSVEAERRSTDALVDQLGRSTPLTTD
jgi:hypothetical protein